MFWSSSWLEELSNWRMDIVINNFFPKEMAIMNFFGLDAIMSTVHKSFEVSGLCEDLWIAFLLRHFRSCHIYRRRQLDYKDDMEKPAWMCLNSAFSALAMLKPIILLQFKTLFTNLQRTFYFPLTIHSWTFLMITCWLHYLKNLKTYK